MSLIFTCHSLGNTIGHHFDVRSKTHLTAQDIDNLLDGKLKGHGWKFKEVEEKYGVNAAFLVSIAILESGNGKSNKAKKRNNCFGLMGKSFPTVEEGIEYVAKIIASPTGYYYGRKKYTIDRIGRTYAPLRDARNRRWIPNVVTIMKRLHNSVAEN